MRVFIYLEKPLSHADFRPRAYSVRFHAAGGCANGLLAYINQAMVQ